MSVTVPAVVGPDRVRSRNARLAIAVLAALAVTVGVVSTVGLLLTHVFQSSWLVDADGRMAHALADHRTPFLDRATGWGTLFADPVPVALLWAGSMGVIYLLLRRWAPVLFVLLAVGGEKTSYFLSTLVVRRPRPDLPTIGTRHITSSFPSGHVGSAISLYGALAVLLVIHVAHRSRRARSAAIVIVAAIAVTVAFCRMYRGFHYMTDIVAGACIGVSWLFFSTRVIGNDDL
jgi:membrane-associated phospholipid phosphatase